MGVVKYHIAYMQHSYSSWTPPPPPIYVSLSRSSHPKRKANNDKNQDSSTVPLTRQATLFWAVGFLLPLAWAANGAEAFTTKIPIKERQQENNTPEKHAKRPNGLCYGPHFVFHLGRHVKQAIYGHSHGRG